MGEVIDGSEVIQPSGRRSRSPKMGFEGSGSPQLFPVGSSHSDASMSFVGQGGSPHQFAFPWIPLCSLIHPMQRKNRNLGCPCLSGRVGEPKQTGAQ